MFPLQNGSFEYNETAQDQKVARAYLKQKDVRIKLSMKKRVDITTRAGR